MKKITLFIFCTITLSGFSQNWQGLTKVDSAESWLGGVTAIGNSLYSIPFSHADTLYFPGSSVPIAPYSSCLVKTDTNGNVVMVKSLGKTEARYISHNSKNIFVTGIFRGNVQIDTFTLHNTSNTQDIFLACFDTLGNVNWLKSFSSNCYDIPFDIQADYSGNVFLTGKVPSYCYLYGEGKGDFFLAKFNSLGQLVWNKTLDSTIYNSQINIGTDGAIYLTGTFHDSLIVKDSLSSRSYYAAIAGFVVKMDSILYVDWVKILPGINYEYAVPFKPVTDTNQNVYIPIGTLGSFTCDSNTFNGSAVIKLNPSGIINHFIYTGLGTYYPHIKFMSDNSIGVMSKTKNCDEVLKLETGLDIIYTGNIINHHDYGAHDTYFDTDNNGNFLIAGNTSDSLSFSNSNLLLPMLNVFQQQTYYVKYGYSSTDILNIFSKKNTVIVFPNPSSGIFTVNLSSFREGRLSVCDVFGNCLMTKDLRGDASLQIDLSVQPKGVYFLKILSDDETAVGKIVVQ